MSSVAEQSLEDHKPEQLLRVRYEDLLGDPAGELGRVGRFLGFADWADWSARCAPRVRTPSADRA
jgi:putative sulfotransferase